LKREPPDIGCVLPLLNQHISVFKSFKLDSDYTKSTDSFSIEVAASHMRDLVGMEAQPIEIYVNSLPVMAGRIDRTEIRDDSSMTIGGRDYMADLVECNIDPTVKLQEGMSIGDAIKIAAGPVGITRVVGADEVVLRNIKTGASLGKPPRPAAMRAKLQKNKPDPGVGIYQYLNQICIRLGCTMQPTPNDTTTIVVSEPDNAQPPAYTIQRSMDRKESAGNNILTASASRDLSSFPTHVLVTGQARPAAKPGPGGGKKAPPPPSIDSKPSSYASTNFDANVFTDKTRILAVTTKGRIKPGQPGADKGKLYRLLYLRDKKSKDVHQLENKAYRLLANRMRDTLVYTATVQGLTTLDGRLYVPDTIVHVKDEVTQVFEKMWVSGVSYSYSPGAGAKTELRCFRKGTFIIGKVSQDG